MTKPIRDAQEVTYIKYIISSVSVSSAQRHVSACSTKAKYASDIESARSAEKFLKYTYILLIELVLFSQMALQSDPVKQAPEDLWLCRLIHPEPVN